MVECATHGGYGVVVTQQLVELFSRVRIPLATHASKDPKGSFVV